MKHTLSLFCYNAFWTHSSYEGSDYALRIVLYYRYINGTLEQQAGPSSKAEDLVFNKEYLNDLPPCYEVKIRYISSVIRCNYVKFRFMFLCTSPSKCSKLQTQVVF